MVRGSGLCCPVCSELIKAHSDFQEQVGTSVDDTIVLSCHRLVSSILVDDVSPSLFFLTDCLEIELSECLELPS